MPQQTVAAASPSAEPKFAIMDFVLSSAEESDMKESVGFEDLREFGEAMKNPKKAMRAEWTKAGTKEDQDNFTYVETGTVQYECFPPHVKKQIQEGMYHGGVLKREEFDMGHENYDLTDFVNLDNCRRANLQDHHVMAIRLYSSSLFSLFNCPMRNRTKPHPIRFTMYILMEGLKMLRKVAAKIDPEGDARNKYLWRGMKDMKMDMDKFKRVGGTELAPMSTTSSREVANAYAGVGKQGHKSLIFRYNTRGLSRGVLIDFLSMYPKEKEYLYPPLTTLIFDDRSDIETDGDITIMPVDPQMA